MTKQASVEMESVQPRHVTYVGWGSVPCRICHMNCWCVTCGIDIRDNFERFWHLTRHSCFSVKVVCRNAKLSAASVAQFFSSTHDGVIAYSCSRMILHFVRSGLECFGERFTLYLEHHLQKQRGRNDTRTGVVWVARTMVHAFSKCSMDLDV